jgi:hypothetical protein
LTPTITLIGAVNNHDSARESGFYSCQEEERHFEI